MDRELWDRLPTTAWMAISDHLSYWDALALAEVFPSFKRLMDNGWHGALEKKHGVAYITNTTKKGYDGNLRVVKEIDGFVHGAAISRNGHVITVCERDHNKLTKVLSTCDLRCSSDVDKKMKVITPSEFFPGGGYHQVQLADVSILPPPDGLRLVWKDCYWGRRARK